MHNLSKKTKLKIIILSTFLIILILSVCTYILTITQKNNNPTFNNHYEERIYKFEEENKYLKDKNIDVVFLGDSLTEGCNLHTLYPSLTVLNRGINGDTTFGLEDRLKISAYDVKPKVVCLLIGINNINTMMQNYESIIQKLKENLPDSKIIILSLTPTGLSYNDYNPLILERNSKLELLSNQYNCTYVDIHSILLNKETNQIYNQYTFEGLHITSEGYTQIANKLTPILQSLINK